MADRKAKAWCQSKGEGLPHFEVSAKENINVEDAFQTIARLALRQQPQVRAAHNLPRWSDMKPRISLASYRAS